MSCKNWDRDSDLSRKCEKILLQMKHTERHEAEFCVHPSLKSKTNMFCLAECYFREQFLFSRHKLIAQLCTRNILKLTSPD